MPSKKIENGLLLKIRPLKLYPHYQENRAIVFQVDQALPKKEPKAIIRR